MSAYLFMATERVSQFGPIKDWKRIENWLRNLSEDELRKLCSPEMEDAEKLKLLLIELRLKF